MQLHVPREWPVLAVSTRQYRQPSRKALEAAAGLPAAPAPRAHENTAPALEGPAFEGGGSDSDAPEHPQRTVLRFTGLSDIVARCKEAYAEDPFLCDPAVWQENDNGTHVVERADGTVWRRGALYVPDAPELRRDCLRAVHDSAWAGHMGIQKTLAAARRLFW